MDTWESVKPILERLWLREDWKLGRIVREMRDSHHFHRVCVNYVPVHQWQLNLGADDLCLQRAPIQDPIWSMGVVEKCSQE